MTTTSSFIPLILISPSLALALRNADNDLNPECLISTGVLVAAVSWEERYGKIYVSWKIDGVIGNDPGGSFDNTAVIDWRRADRKPSETSETFQ